MVSNHFSGLYSGQYAWAALFILIAGGAGVRHALNLRFTSRYGVPASLLIAAATALLLDAAILSGSRAAPMMSLTGPASFADVRHVIDRRCAACHSATPTDEVYKTAPVGVMFDTPDQIVAMAARIRERAVITRTMPLANKTGITDAERALLGRWIEQGAKK